MQKISIQSSIDEKVTRLTGKNVEENNIKSSILGGFPIRGIKWETCTFPTQT